MIIKETYCQFHDFMSCYVNLIMIKVTDFLVQAFYEIGFDFRALAYCISIQAVVSFKDLLNRLANQSQISFGVSMGGQGDESFINGPSHQDGSHAHI